MKDEDDVERGTLRPATRVPSGRVSRLLHMGATATRLAAGGLAEKAKRLSLSSEATRGLPHALFTKGNAEVLAARLARLRGAAMKVGQMLSLEGDNLLPLEFTRALEVLRSSAHQMPEAQVRSVLSSELGVDFERHFESLDLQPIASASIGQVHRAVALDGRQLVLKIQYPGVSESVESDVDNLRALLSLARLLPGELDVDALTEEIKRELAREVDYEREGQKLNQYRELLLHDKDYWVPRALLERSSKRILVMEWAPGVELLKWARTASQVDRDRIGTSLVRLLFKEFFELGLSQTDPNPANYLVHEEGGQLVLIDLGAARSVPKEVSTLYRKGLGGMLHRDRVALRAVVAELGLDVTGDSPATDLVVSVALDAAAIFQPGAYDFATSDLADRLRERSAALRQVQKNLRAPAPHFIFFQRKMAGTFLLCRNLGARVDCHALLTSFL